MIFKRKNLLTLTMIFLVVMGISTNVLVAFGQDAGTEHVRSDCAMEDADNVQEESDSETDDVNEIQCSEDSVDENDSGDCATAAADNVQEEVDTETDDATEIDANEVDDVNEAGDANETDDANEAGDANETDCNEQDELQNPAYTGSIVIDNSIETVSEADEATALASLATITAEDAQTAVETETGALVVKVGLENENGFLVYSVELEDGTDVKVDAGNATILHTEPAGSAESD